ncbi:MAG: hypothetical protein AAF702_45830 [Chloroflexota bacterium]
MRQEVLNHPHNDLSNISFQQKSTALSLVITIGATVYYIVNMWPMRALTLDNNAMPDGFGTLVIGTVALIIIAQIVLQSALAIQTGTAPATTAHEKSAALKATRNAYNVLTAGIFFVIGSVFVAELALFYTANLAILSFALSEIVKDVSRLFYGRSQIG